MTRAWEGLERARPAGDWLRNLRVGVQIAFLLWIFLAGVNGMGDGFTLVGRSVLDQFFAATSDPIVGLMVGLLATSLVQSSSVITSIIVGLVAAPEHPLPLENAIPMVMGSNIGTTVTNTLVSLAHIGRPDEFQRAFAAATCHDFFNFLTVAVLLPLELATGYLERSATALAGMVSAGSDLSYESPIDGLLELTLAPLKMAAAWLFADWEQAQGLLLVAVSAALIFVALIYLVVTMRQVMLKRAESIVERAVGRSGLIAILVGLVVTMSVQSSSITTSLLVPFAGAGLLTLEQVFPVTLGANIGTTITALLASLAVSGPNAGLGITIAIVHTLFNLTGTLIFYPFPPLRRIPLTLARKLAAIAVRSRKWALAYVLLLFYGLPGLIAMANRLLE